MRNNKIRTYSELSKLNTIEERFNYLKINGNVCEETFGFDRYMNQKFYRSKEWKQVRDFVIVRDNGCDMGLKGNEINGSIYIHHMNPLKESDIKESTDKLLNPDYLVCVSYNTHNAIHYGTIDNLKKEQIITRNINDTCPWKK